MEVLVQLAIWEGCVRDPSNRIKEITKETSNNKLPFGGVGAIW